MPRARLAVGGYAAETTGFVDHKFSPLERLPYLLTAAVLYGFTEMPAPPSSRALLLLCCWGGRDPPSSSALLLGGGSAMSLVVQGG